MENSELLGDSDCNTTRAPLTRQSPKLACYPHRQCQSGSDPSMSLIPFAGALQTGWTNGEESKKVESVRTPTSVVAGLGMCEQAL